MFAELIRQFSTQSTLGIDVARMDARIINHYLLADSRMCHSLGVRRAKNEWTALASYLASLPLPSSTDVIHNTFYLPNGLAPTRGAARIVTIHDMIPEILPRTRRRLDLLTLKSMYVARADHIICVSEATRQDLIRIYPHIEAPITVVHSGVDERFQRNPLPPPDLPPKYMVMVGNRHQYKDGPILMRAFAAIAFEHPDLHLVFVGGGAFTREEQEWISANGLGSRIHQRTVSDEVLPQVLSHCQVFVFPSRFEGFGLPALEAMACGAPTVLSRITAFTEIAGDAALYFTAGDPDDLAGVLVALLADESRRATLTERGLTRARAFSWTKTAELTARVYRQARGESAS